MCKNYIFLTLVSGSQGPIRRSYLSKGLVHLLSYFRAFHCSMSWQVLQLSVKVVFSPFLGTLHLSSFGCHLFTQRWVHPPVISMNGIHFCSHTYPHRREGRLTAVVAEELFS